MRRDRPTLMLKRTAPEFSDDKWPMATHHLVEALENVTEAADGL
jgi:hypothetical protein